MVCLVCKKNVAGDCFTLALETLKEHYTFYKNSVSQRDEELHKIRERNEELNQALELLQSEQQSRPSKKFKAHNERTTKPSPLIRAKNNNAGGLTDTSLTDDDYAGPSNLNMALNSEQLFESSGLSSPAKSETSIISASEVPISPHNKVGTLRSQKEKENLHSTNVKSLEKSKSEWQSRDTANTSQSNKSWALSFFPKPNATVSAKRNGKIGVNIKPEKKVNLSLKKTNPSKIKQATLQFESCKDSSVIESDICEDVIDASPVPLSKNSRSGKSWAHRSGHNQSSHSPTINNKIEGIQQKPDRKNSSIENIVFDFSPTKNNEHSSETTYLSKTNMSSKELHFDGNDTESSNKNSSSVVLLTPATQDIIFIDESTNDFGDIDTMDLLADVREHETEYMANLKKIESKNIEKRKRQDVKSIKNDDDKGFLKPAAFIKKEKSTQEILDGKRNGDERVVDMDTANINKHENIPINSTTEKKKDLIKNYLDDEDEDEDEDAMPKPFVVKKETDDYQHTSKTLTVKERFGIDCDNCEKLLRLLGPHITNREFEMHLNKCNFHNQPDFMRQNTPEGFWNPLMLTFDENDPRNEVLIDTRFKDNKLQLGK
ncbi:CTBP-interacting protein [Haematobia irritans]|uniref:CTBP-interacting protein n=1 Tax=Haematobia irritans TaxID=7368 RepID=UPI003F504584